jgi:hypothetical protein
MNLYRIENLTLLICADNENDAKKQLYNALNELVKNDRINAYSEIKVSLEEENCESDE